MSFGKPPATPVDPELAGIDLSKEPTNQESIVIPYVAGEYTIAAHWFSPVYNQVNVEAPATNPGKK